MVMVAMPPNALSTPNTDNGIIWWNPTKAPIKGADSSHTRAHITHDSMQIFRFSGGTSSAVLVNNIDCDVDTATFATNAVNIKYIDVSSSETKWMYRSAIYVDKSREYIILLNLHVAGRRYPVLHKSPAIILKTPVHCHFWRTRNINKKPMLTPNISETPKSSRCFFFSI